MATPRKSALLDRVRTQGQQTLAPPEEIELPAETKEPEPVAEEAPAPAEEPPAPAPARKTPAAKKQPAAKAAPAKKAKKVPAAAAPPAAQEATVSHLAAIVAAGKDLRAYRAEMPEAYLLPTNVRLPVYLTEELEDYCDRKKLPIQALIATLLDGYFRDVGVLDPLAGVIEEGR